MSHWKPWHALAFIFFALVLLPTLVQRPDRTDLHILYQAAVRLEDHAPVYRLEEANEHTKPPLATMVFIPFTWLPLFWLSRLWDLINLVCFVSLGTLLIRRAQFPERWNRISLWWMAAFVVLTPFNAELRLGQYNVLLALALVVGVFSNALWLGTALCLAVLFKPTFLVLAPWVFFQSRYPARVLVSGAGTLALLSGTYALVFGYWALIADMQEWVRFLPLSSAKHLLRYDNHGLPSWLAAHWGSPFDKFLLLLALALTAVASYRDKKGLGSLALGCGAMIVVSPMAWLQNYTLLLPAVLWAMERITRPTTARVFYQMGLGILWLSIGALNPTTSKWLGAEHWEWQRIPLWGLLVFGAFCCLGLKKEGFPVSRILSGRLERP